jgi:long-chain acyl-CoA synthetase
MINFLLLNSFIEYSDSKITEISSSIQYTYKEFYEEIVIQSKKVQLLEIPKKSIVVIYGYRSSLKSLLTLFACIKCELIPHIVAAGDLDRVCDLQYSAVFSQSEIKNSQIVLEYKGYTNESYFYINTNGTPYLGTDNDLIVVSSSGSTSFLPKKILLGKQETMANIDSNKKMLSITKTDYTLLMLPVSYSYGLIAQFFTHIYVGANILIGEKILSILQLSSLLKKHGVTNFFMTPLIARLLLYYNQNKGHIENDLNFVTIGGGKPQEDTVRRINKLLNCPIYGTYGLAEAGPRVSTNKISVALKDFSLTIGETNPEVEVEIINKKKYQELCETENVGYLKIKSPSIYLGYIKGNLLVKSPSNKELITKDIGINNNGAITILGREDEFIKINDKPIWFYKLSEEFYKHPNIIKITISKTDYDTLNIKVFYRGRVNITEITDSLDCKYNLRQGINYELFQIKFNNAQYK